MAWPRNEGGISAPARQGGPDTGSGEDWGRLVTARWRGEDGWDQGEALPMRAFGKPRRDAAAWVTRAGKASAGGQGETVFVVTAKRFGE